MAKWQNDLMLDAALDYISTNADEIFVCNAQPTTYTEAATTFALTSVEAPTFQANADGDASGRKLAVDEEADMSITSTDDATHIALCKNSGSVLLYVTTCTTQSLTSGGTVTVPTWDIEIEDAA
jgi:hypothetical protein